MNLIVPQDQAIAAGARPLLAAYTYVLDEGPLMDWPTLFTESCLYRITTRQNEERNMPLSIMLCDNHAMLYDRVMSAQGKLQRWGMQTVCVDGKAQLAPVEDPAGLDERRRALNFPPIADYLRTLSPTCPVSK